MECVFCQLDRSLLAESDLSCAFLDGFPTEYTDAFNLVRHAKDLVQQMFDPQGFNIGVNCGEAAGQTVFHAHIHIIPRYTGDVLNPRGGVRNIIPSKGNY